MRVQPSSRQVEFPTFCEAVRTWLADAVCLDPALAAVADLIETRTFADEELASLVSGAADTHAVLGASALLSLWSGLSR